MLPRSRSRATGAATALPSRAANLKAASGSGRLRRGGEPTWLGLHRRAAFAALRSCGRFPDPESSEHAASALASLIESARPQGRPLGRPLGMEATNEVAGVQMPSHERQEYAYAATRVCPFAANRAAQLLNEKAHEI